LRRRRFAFAGVGMVLVLAAIAFGTWLYQRAQFAEQAERSIAVLPFENHSPRSEDTYFTLGMQNEISGDLAKLAGMKVIGSQSTRSYLAGKPRDLRAISHDLGVRHLLEGTVAREDEQIMVTVRLTDVRDSAHPWTEAYRRPIEDVFSVQSEIMRAVAAQIRKPLSPTEKTVLDTPPTTDLRAYDLYLQVRAMRPATESEFFAESKRALPM